MNNLNPFGTGFMLPNTQTNPDLSFIPPPPGRVGPALPGPDNFSPTDDDPPPQNQPQVVDLASMTKNEAYKGCYWFRIPLNYNNYGYEHVGKYSRVNGKRFDGALQSEEPWVLCLPSLTTDQGASTPPAFAVDRITSDEFAGTLVLTGGEAGTANLFRETGTAAPPIIAVAGYSVPAGQTYINAIRRIYVNGTAYLAICFQSGGAGNSVQILSDLANPPTSSTIPVGAVPTYDIIQTAIDGNALLIYTTDAAGNGIIYAVRTDVAVGGLAFSAPRCYIPAGGYGVGLSDCEDDGTFAYWVVPQDGIHLLFNVTGAGVTSKGNLLKTDARGYLPVFVDVPLRWVTFVDKWRGGLVMCDTYTHWYLNKNNPRGKWRKMPVFENLPENSSITYTCCGHYQKAGKLLIETNEVAASGVSPPTTRYAMEFDYDKWKVVQIETDSVTGAGGVKASRGGMRLPWSPFSNYKYVREVERWEYQQVFPLGTDIFNLRHTTGATAGTGVESSPEDSITFPVMDIDGIEDCAKTITSISGPKPGAVAEGGTGAYVLIEELLSGRTGTGPNGNGAQFFGTEPSERVQKREYNTISWTYQIQPKITIHRATSGTDATRLNINAFNNQVFIEGIAVRDPINAPVASILKAMDQQKLGQPV